MPIYEKIKNKICLAYYGPAKEYLIQIKLLRPFLEHKFKDLKIYIACKPDSMYLLQDEERIIKSENKKDLEPNKFGLIKEIICNTQSHPVEKLFIDSNLEIPTIQTTINKFNSRIAVIYPQATFPTKSLSNIQIDNIKQELINDGYDVKASENITHADLIVGPENEQVFSAAATGINTILIKSGLGTAIFAKMFPNAKIR